MKRRGAAVEPQEAVVPSPPKSRPRRTKAAAPTNLVRLKAQEKRQKVFQMRTEGLSFRQISKKLHMSEGDTARAFALANQEFNEAHPEIVAEVRTLHFERLEEQLVVYRKKALAGDREAAKIVISITKEIAAYFAPPTQEHVHSGHVVGTMRHYHTVVSQLSDEQIAQAQADIKAGRRPRQLQSGVGVGSGDSAPVEGADVDVAGDAELVDE